MLSAALLSNSRELPEGIFAAQIRLRLLLNPNPVIHRTLQRFIPILPKPRQQSELACWKMRRNSVRVLRARSNSGPICLASSRKRRGVFSPHRQRNRTNRKARQVPNIESQVVVNPGIVPLTCSEVHSRALRSKASRLESRVVKRTVGGSPEQTLANLIAGVVLTLTVALELGTIEVDFSQVPGTVSFGFVVEVR